MLNKITWQEGKVLSLKLKDGLFTLVQMRKISTSSFLT